MTRLVRFSNNAVSKLAGAITSSSTTITLQTGDGAKFPALTGSQYFMATLVKSDGTTEVVKVTARSSDTLTVVRAAEAVAGVQTSYAFSSGDRIEHRLTAGVVASEIDRLDQAAYISPLNKSANYTITANDVTSLVRVNTGSGNVTITLPEISTLTQDFDVIVAKVTGDTNVATIQRGGTTDTINGATSYALTNQWQGAWLTADSSTGTWTVIASGAGGVKANVDTFTGAGSAGPFTLSGDPGIKENTAVYVGGVYQQKSTYTLVGTSLTLGGTVATGIPIEVIWAQPLAVGTTSASQTTASDGSSGSRFTTVQGFITSVLSSSGSSLVGFIQSGTGAAASDVQTKLRETVSVKDFGAVGDGTTDDTAAVQAAVNASKIVFFPKGSYKLSTPVILNGFNTLKGESTYVSYTGIYNEGSIIKPTTAAFITSSPDTHNIQSISISGLTFVGGSNPIDLGKCHQVEVFECAFTGWSGNAICIYQGEKHRYSQLFFWPTNGVANSCFSFCTKADSINTMTGTDTSMFLDRVSFTDIFLNPASGWPSNAVNYLLKCGGELAHCTFNNVVSHATLKDSFKLYKCSHNIFENITFDGGGVSGAPQDATFTIDHNTVNSTFISLYFTGGTFYRNATFVAAGSLDRTTFISCQFGIGNNISTFGFKQSGVSDATAIFVRCSGSFYSAMAAANLPRGTYSFNMLGCNFSPTNCTQTIMSDTAGNDILVATVSPDYLGSSASTAKIMLGQFAAGSGGTINPLYLKKDNVLFNKPASFINNYGGETYFQVVQPSLNNVSPEGNLTAYPGSLCLFFNSSVPSGKLYVKESGTGNTGWVLK